MKTFFALMLFALPALASEICFFKYERTSGMSTICFYDCISGPAAITIRATEICPITIERN